MALRHHLSDGELMWVNTPKSVFITSVSGSSAIFFLFFPVFFHERVAPGPAASLMRHLGRRAFRGEERNAAVDTDAQTHTRTNIVLPAKWGVNKDNKKRGPFALVDASTSLQSTGGNNYGFRLVVGFKVWRWRKKKVSGCGFFVGSKVLLGEKWDGGSVFCCQLQKHTDNWFVLFLNPDNKTTIIKRMTCKSIIVAVFPARFVSQKTNKQDEIHKKMHHGIIIKMH